MKWIWALMVLVWAIVCLTELLQGKTVESRLALALSWLALILLGSELDRQP